MRHHDNKRKFHREKRQRVALMRSLSRSLVMHEKIETTIAKAKELRPYIERLVTSSKKSDPRIAPKCLGENRRRSQQ
jgi:large subunit ribosomal protein L17